MSALGQKQTLGTKSELALSFDQLVGAQQNRFRNFYV
jgi:hypothetical protein